MDRDYVPSSSEQSDVEVPALTETEKTRKRVRKPETWKRNISKKRRNSGQGYVGRKGEVHHAKSVKVYEHTCRYKCSENFSEDTRNRIFTDFWDLGRKPNGWDLQNAFIASSITKNPPKLHRQNAIRQKSISTSIKLQNKRVCKLFFLKSLDISRKRFCNALRKKKESGVVETDQRGRHIPGNKIDEGAINLVKEHINSFPKFVSHYTRTDNPNRKYLSPELNVTKMYKLYEEFCVQKEVQPLKLSKYRNIFTTQFNLSFHKPYSDTCSTCDKFKTQKDACDPQSEEGLRLEVEHSRHLRQAEAAKDLKNKAKESAEQFPHKRAICFDLQKTFPTPYLTCSKVYYLRQLWTYNLNVHDLASGVGTMYMWHEAEGSKGSQDVMSCLLKYIQCLPETVTHIDSFSDNCGGQNKNKNIVKFWMYIVQNTHIKSVDHRFFVSGHSFMECDQDFAVIEKAKRRLTHIFTPEEWVSFVAGVSRKFIVVKMQPKDFKSISPIDNLTKCNFTGLSKMQWLHFEHKQPYKLFYKQVYNVDLPFEEIDYSKKTVSRGRPRKEKINLPVLYKVPPKIKMAKYNNLMQLLPFIPPIHHNFYKSLNPEEQQTNDGNYNNDDTFGNIAESDNDE